LINEIAVTFKMHHGNAVSAEKGGGISQEGPYVRQQGCSESGPNVFEQKPGHKPCVLHVVFQ